MLIRYISKQGQRSTVYITLDKVANVISLLKSLNAKIIEIKG